MRGRKARGRMSKTVQKWSKGRDARVLIGDEPPLDYRPDATIVMRRFVLMVDAKAAIPHHRHLDEAFSYTELYRPEPLEELPLMVALTYADFNLPVTEHEHDIFTMGASRLREFLDHIEAVFDGTWDGIEQRDV